MSTPTLSVLTTAYNREDYIAECIESVLASSYADFEYIIVDDASTDGTYEIAKAYEHDDARICVYRNAINLGDYPNRNKAATYAVGTYIKYVDSDNVIYPFGLASMVDCLEKFPKAGLGLLSKSDPDQPYPICIDPPESYHRNFIGDFDFFGRAPDSAIIRRSCFEELSGFSGKNLIGDYEMWLRMAQQYPLVLLPPYLGWDRIHPNQEKNIDPLDYWMLRYSTTQKYLEENDCPLGAKRIKEALKLMRKSLRKGSAKLLLTRRFRDALRSLYFSLPMVCGNSS